MQGWSGASYVLVSFGRNVIITSVTQSFLLLTGSHELQLRLAVYHLLYYNYVSGRTVNVARYNMNPLTESIS